MALRTLKLFPWLSDRNTNTVDFSTNSKMLANQDGVNSKECRCGSSAIDQAVALLAPLTTVNLKPSYRKLTNKKGAF